MTAHHPSFWRCAPASPIRRRRHGVTAVLAMLYLVLFSTLAVGFYAAFTLTMQASYNDRGSRRALSAAESGMEFIRYHLWELSITYSSSPSALFDAVGAALEARLNGSANLGGGNIARVGDTIYIPSQSDYIKFDNSDAGFRIELTHDGTQLLVTCIGRSSASTSSETADRGVRLRYGLFQRPSSIFNYGVASRGPVSLDSNAMIVGTPNPAHGSLLSTAAGGGVSVQGNSSVSGDVSIVDAGGTVSVGSSASIAGSTNALIKAQHIHKGVTEPEFPTIDTDIYKPYATNVVSTPGAKFDTVNVKNLYIKAGVNPIFAGSIKVQGVVYIETPNKVLFDSNVEITGVIVTQNNPTGSLSDNTIDLKSNVKLRGVENLPATADFPAELRALAGASILAPGFRLTFDSNLGVGGGSIVGSEVRFDSNATGTINGSVINLGPGIVTMNSNAAITIANQGASYAPAGMYFSNRYTPLPASYEEVFVPKTSTTEATTVELPPTQEGEAVQNGGS